MAEPDRSSTARMIDCWLGGEHHHPVDVAAARAFRLQPATEAVGTVRRELHAYHADADLRDDAVVVCLDWRGSRPVDDASGR